MHEGATTMFDANKILGVLMESGMAGSSQSRVQRAVGGGSPLLDNALQRLSASSRGAGGGSQVSGGTPRSSGGGLADIAGALLGGGGAGGGLGGLGALLGGSSGRGGAISGGAMGLLGTLAAAAMQQFSSPQAAAQPGMAEDAAPYRGDEAPSGEHGRAMLMIRAMITAARADGEIDPQERQRILGKLEEAGADPEAQAFVREEMTRPVDVQAIVGAVDSPHTAIEAYAASLFAIDVDTPAEAAYMRQLAQGLGLNPTLVRELHASLEAPPLH
jgi:uncharacterized membrane protein YebE (DUF533 family)